MKFIAILRDSFREAMDGWIIYLMIIGTALVILLVASISFRPLTVQEDVDSIPKMFNLIASFGGVPPGTPTPTYSLENFKQTNDAAEPWNGDYAFDVAIKFKTEADKKTFQNNVPHMVLGAGELKRMLRSEDYYYLDNVEVKDVTKEPTEFRYHVTTRGTKVKNHLAWKHEPKIFFAVSVPFIRISIEGAVYQIEKWLIHKFGAWLAIMIGIVVTAFFVPNLMRKGSIDLVCSKPVRYWQVLLYKYIGGLAFMAVVTTVTIGGIWFVLGLRSGIWGPGFLLLIPAILFYFAILYSVSVLMAALTRNAIVAILVTFLAWGVFYVNGVLHSFVESERKAIERFNQPEKEDDEIAPPPGRRQRPARVESLLPDWVGTTSDIIHAVLPRTSDLDDLSSKLISDSVLSDVEKKKRGLDQEKYPSWAATIGVSLGFIGIMLGLACWRFSTRDY